MGWFPSVVIELKVAPKLVKHSTAKNYQYLSMFEFVQNRGLDDKKLLPYFPYRDDSELLLLTITRMVEDYVGT